jgi:hypothetical protein
VTPNILSINAAHCSYASVKQFSVQRFTVAKPFIRA